MPYITTMRSPMYHQITFDEIISGDLKAPIVISANETNTMTYYAKELNADFLRKYNYQGMVIALQHFCDKHQNLYQVDRRSLYDTFYLPKKSGGLREINAPVPDLMNALRELKTILENKFFALYHTSAFAYVKGRCTLDAVKKHQNNGSHWFLKTDFSNFFGSVTPDFVMQMLSLVFPFSQVICLPGGEDALRKAIDLCFLDGGLPQGTPISPMLTNLIMIPLDHRINNCLRDFKGHSYVYTRYADDILVSSRHHFDYLEIVRFINQSLRDFRAPFSIKKEKTRYGSRAGSNWNLGVMLNKDNQITIGAKNKQRFKAMICNYALDKKNGKPWELRDVQVLAGIINYYRSVERENINNIITSTGKKFSIDIEKAIKQDLSA